MSFLFKMIVLLLAAVLSGCDAILPETLVQEQWEEYKLEYRKVYQGEIEHQYRLKVFMNNLHEIYEHNKLYEMGLSSFWLKINQFSDLLHSEFLEIFMINATDYEDDMENVLVHETHNLDLPEDTMDWRTKGAVTPIKNQGRCGSCYCFAVTGALEGQWFKKTGNLVSLSEQNLLDCTRRIGNFGCRGGYPHKTFQYIINNGGVDTESSYPYQGREMNCRFNPNNVGAKEREYGRGQSGSEASLQSIVSHIGPTTVNIDITDPKFQHYGGGVYNNPSCSTTRGGHIVLVIGYGNEGGHDYWLVKNSWGTWWGEHGYIRMSRNKNNQCGIATWVFYPIV